MDPPPVNCIRDVDRRTRIFFFAHLTLFSIEIIILTYSGDKSKKWHAEMPADDVCPRHVPTAQQPQKPAKKQ